MTRSDRAAWIRIYDDPLQHLLDGEHPVDDVRLAFTVCGIRFAWGECPRRRALLRRCSECFA